MAALARFLLALAMLPAACGLVRAAIRVMMFLASADDSIISSRTAAFLSGFALFAFVWVVLPKPVSAYVLGHELSHAVWALAFGGKVSNLKFGPNGGHVNVSKSNMFITLAPYFFPIYTIIVVIAALITELCMGRLPWQPLWIGLVGFTWAFHVFFTIKSLLIRQPDIQEYGRLFSYNIIAIFNIAGVLAWIGFTTDFPFWRIGTVSCECISEAYKFVADAAATFWHLATSTTI